MQLLRLFFISLLLPACAGQEAGAPPHSLPSASGQDVNASDTLEMESLRIAGLRPGDSLAHARQMLPPPDSLRLLYLEMQDRYELQWHAGHSRLEFEDSVLRRFWVQDGSLALEAGGERLRPGDPESAVRRRFPRSDAQARTEPATGLRALRVRIRGFDADLVVRLEGGRVHSIELWEEQ